MTQIVQPPTAASFPAGHGVHRSDPLATPRAPCARVNRRGAETPRCHVSGTGRASTATSNFLREHSSRHHVLPNGVARPNVPDSASLRLCVSAVPLPSSAGHGVHRLFSVAVPGTPIAKVNHRGNRGHREGISPAARAARNNPSSVRSVSLCGESFFRWAWAPSFEFPISCRGALRPPASVARRSVDRSGYERSAGARSAPLHGTIQRWHLRWAWSPSFRFAAEDHRRSSAFTRLREARYGGRRKVCGKTFLSRWAWGSSLEFATSTGRISLAVPPRPSAFIRVHPPSRSPLRRAGEGRSAA